MPNLFSITIITLIISAGVIYADDTRITIETLKGEVFEKVKVTEVRPDGLRFFHSKGVAFIPFRELPKELQEKYNYDSKTEKEFHQNADIAQKRAYILQEITKRGLKAEIRVTQVTDGGILASGYYLIEAPYEHTEYRTETRKVGLERYQTVKVPVKTETRIRTGRHALPDLIFIAGSFKNLVDDDAIQTMIYPCGRYQYTTVMGGAATVERYATTPEKAMALMLSGK